MEDVVMKSIGGLMLLFGAGSITLSLVGFELALMMWVDYWGTTVGWFIRLALTVVGGFMWLFGEDVEGHQPKESEAT